MNLHQLEYIIAIDKHKHFVRAAEACFVTQATLSMMIKKLEEELNVIIFDRSKQPVVATEIGEIIIRQAKIILSESKKLVELIKDEKKEMSGEIKLGIIPTVAPYLLPLFLNNFLKKYPKILVKINEFTTDQLIEKLITQEIDMAILATPLGNQHLLEIPLYYEKLLVYTPSKIKQNIDNQKDKKYILPEDIDVNKLWLLEEGHCLRSQIVNLCELKKQTKMPNNLEYNAGSIETLIKMTEINDGITILPELAISNLNENQLKYIYPFKTPEPAREISIVTYQYYIKNTFINALKAEILACIPKEMVNKDKKENISI